MGCSVGPSVWAGMQAVRKTVAGMQEMVPALVGE